MQLAGFGELGQRGVERLPRTGHFGLQGFEGLLLGVQLGLQLLPTFHHLEEGILQAGLATLQGLQLVLQVRQLFGVGRSRLQQRPVTVFALAHRVDLRFEPLDVGVDVFQGDPHRTDAVAGGVVFLLHAPAGLFAPADGPPGA